MAITNFTNITDFGGILQVANDNASGSFWTAMLYMVFFVMVMSLSIFGIETALLASAFICLLVGMLFVYAGLMAWVWLMPFLGMILTLFLYIVWSSKDN